MKKLFLILAVLCLSMMPIVIAETQTQSQPVMVTVAEVTELTITPPSLDFGSVRPLIPGKGEDVTFDSSKSNVDVTVGSSVEEGSVFENIDFLLSDNVVKNIKSFSISLPVSAPNAIVGTQITLPTGLVPGVRNGVITYTITSTFCGDDAINGWEVCDGTKLNEQSCVTKGFAGGTLACKADCSEFDTSQCTTECIPNCEGKTCGDDGCGGSCGTCTEGTCNAGICTIECVMNEDCEEEGQICNEQGVCVTPTQE